MIKSLKMIFVHFTFASDRNFLSRQWTFNWPSSWKFSLMFPAMSTLFCDLAHSTDDLLNVKYQTSWPKEQVVLASDWMACWSVTLALSNAIITSFNSNCCFRSLQWVDFLQLMGFSLSAVQQSWSSLSASRISAQWRFSVIVCWCRSSSLLIWGQCFIFSLCIPPPDPVTVLISQNILYIHFSDQLEELCPPVYAPSYYHIIKHHQSLIEICLHCSAACMALIGLLCGLPFLWTRNNRWEPQAVGTIAHWHISGNFVAVLHALYFEVPSWSLW